MAKVTARKETGKLVIDFTYRGVRCREQTALADTPQNRRKAEAVVARIKAALSAGTFAYAKFFPGSSLAARFASLTSLPSSEANACQATASTEAIATASVGSTTPTFRDFAAQGLADHQVEWRRSHIKVLRSTLNGHLLPHFGDKPVGGIVKATCSPSEPRSLSCLAAAAKR